MLFYLEDVDIGGQQTMNYHYIKNLDRNKHQIFIAYYLDGKLKKSFEAVSDELIQLAPPPKSWSAATKNPLHVLPRAIQLYRYLKKRNIDIVLSNGPYVYIMAAIACFLAGCKHGRLLGKEPSKEKFLWRYFHLIPLHRFTDLFFGFSYGNKELLSKGVKKQKLIDLDYGVDSQLFRPLYNEEERAAHRQALGISPDELVIGWIGRIYEKINGRDGELVFSLKVAKTMKDKGFNHFKFLVVGGGPWMKGMKERAKTYGIAEHMIYLGWQLMEKVPHFHNLLDIFPVLDYDAIGGSKLRESMSCGRVVISVSGASGYQATWIKHGINGILVSPTNFIEEAAQTCIELHKLPKKRKALGAAGRTYAVKHMDFSIKTKILEAACEKILE